MPAASGRSNPTTNCLTRSLRRRSPSTCSTRKKSNPCRLSCDGVCTWSATPAQRTVSPSRTVPRTRGCQDDSPVNEFQSTRTPGSIVTREPIGTRSCNQKPTCVRARCESISPVCGYSTFSPQVLGPIPRQKIGGFTPAIRHDVRSRCTSTPVSITCRAENAYIARCRTARS